VLLIFLQALAVTGIIAMLESSKTKSLSKKSG